MVRKRAKKNFCVVAYDVADNKRREKVGKLLERYGVRANFSVFECMMTDRQFEELEAKIAGIIDLKEDSVIYYSLCMNCYTKIVRLPDRRRSLDNVAIC